MARSLNPANNSLIKSYDDYPGPFVDKIIEEVELAQKEWKKKNVRERAELVGRLGETLLHKKEKLAKVCSEEMGKLMSEAISEVEKCATACSYYAENAEKFLADDSIKTESVESYVTYEPLGVVLAIMPWNFPYWQVIRFAAPALCAGNGCLLKHASNVPGCSLALEEVIIEAGFPKNLFRSLIIPAKEVNRVIRNEKVRAVTLTGSTKAGVEVAKVAGEELKKVVLELGGSDAYLILKDANLKYAARTLVKGRMLNAGQSCISPKRLIIDQSVYAEFVSLVEKEMKQFPNIAPLARADLRETLQQQIDKSLKQGAKRILGGEISKGEGAHYPPTLLVDVKPGMTAFDEEMFGPVVCLISAKDEAEMIKFANMSEYGLGSGIFSEDLKHAARLAQDIEAGGVFINDFLRSDTRLPFGGVKHSGHGRELSFIGIKEFVNAKTVSVNNSKNL